MSLVHEVKIPLTVPVPVKDADGKEAKRDSITLHRPNLAHAKAIAVLIGPKIATELMRDASAGVENVDIGVLITELSATIFTIESLDALTHVVASMAREEVAFIEQLDWLDIKKIGDAWLDFFPALRSLGRSNTQPT